MTESAQKPTFFFKQNEYIMKFVGQSGGRLEPFFSNFPFRLPVRRKSFALCVHDDHVYVAGGIGVDGGYLNTVHRFAVKENRWETLAPMSKRRASFSLLYLNGCLYAIGGNSDANNMTNTTETFDVRRQKWKKETASATVCLLVLKT